MYLSIELLRFFKQGVLVEYNEEARAIFEQLPAPIKTRLTFTVTDFGDWKDAHRFDCVVACEVLEHVQEDGRFLQKMAQFLKPSGQLILSVPSRMKYWSTHDEIVGHVRRYEKEEITRLLIANGYQQVQVLAYGFPFVNLLRIPRIMLAHRQANQKREWSRERQTKESGFVKGGSLLKLSGLLINPVTIFPLALFSTLFNKSDWSGGYVITATYVGKNEP